eukprot:TRINITY_DN67348_c0_g1_i1.p1 TRINITY_DN67348_c0_g1~~TRINITY_DN67348_c0_g1_i1.p1  ORF type:complete len:855 (+),score=153.80 TRINITY_DN67348_c0_g1_i1:24-2567(+)
MPRVLRATDSGLGARARRPVGGAPVVSDRGTLAVSGKRHHELPTTRVARESISFLTRWLNYVCGSCLGWTPITAETLFEDLRTGVVLCRLVERLVPSGVDFNTARAQGVNMKPRTRRPCMMNIDLALQVAWKQGVLATNMCTADDVYECRVLPVTRCLVELFQVLQMRLQDIRSRTFDVLSKMQEKLKVVGLPFSAEVMTDPIGEGAAALLADLKDGFRLTSLLTAFGRAPPEETQRLIAHPTDHEVRENLGHLCRSLTLADCPQLLATPAEWFRPPAPCPDTLIFQLYVLWRSLCTGASSSPTRIATPLSFTAESALEAETESEQWHDEATIEELLVESFVILDRAFGSTEAAFTSLCQPKANKITQASFAKAMTSLGFKCGAADLERVWNFMDWLQLGTATIEDFRQAESVARETIASLPPSTGQAGSRGLLSDSASALRRERLDSITPDTVLVVDFEQQPAHFALQPLVDAAGVGGEVRLPCVAEERQLLFDEDTRRQVELHDEGALSFSRKIKVATAMAAAAAAEAADAAAADCAPALPRPGAGGRAVELGPPPTSSIDARIIYSDNSLQRVWVMSGVRDRVPPQPSPVGATSSQASPRCTDEVVFMLEIRDAAAGGTVGSANAAGVFIQVDVSQVLSVERLATEEDAAPSATFTSLSTPAVNAAVASAAAELPPGQAGVSFLVALRRGAHVGGMAAVPPGEEEEALSNDEVDEDSRGGLRSGGKGVGGRGFSRFGGGRAMLARLRARGALGHGERPQLVRSVYHASADNAVVLLCITAGPSAWKKREATRFFDELRILAHFLSGRGSANAQPPAAEASGDDGMAINDVAITDGSTMSAQGPR